MGNEAMQRDPSVNVIDSEEQLDDMLSAPTPALCEAIARLDGDILILGVGGKMGPTLARLARRAADLRGSRRQVIGVSRFETGDLYRGLQQVGVRTIQCDLMDESAIARLPPAPNVIYLAGRKFGTDEDPALTWAMNAYVPGLVARHFRGARIVALSTGNVYPLSPISSPGPAESDPVGPVGEYAQSCLARERIFEYFSARYGTPVTLVRLNYAVELRYGVLLDIARKVHAREVIDLTMGYVNLIWQRDANEAVIRCLELCASPPEIINLAGPMVAVRELAKRFAMFFGIDPIFSGHESGTALLSNGHKAERLFGPQTISLDRMIELVAHWVSARRKVHGLPTHFEQRQGHF
jgi:nucleoside-diphosphate-sugar epimerase